MSVPKIFVGFIVQNEAMYVPYSLGSIYPYVNHIIVVDGGSTDQTIPLIQALDTEKKITIIRHRFLNDYSQALNVYLKHFRDHIWTPRDEDNHWMYLRLDSDEIFSGN